MDSWSLTPGLQEPCPRGHHQEHGGKEVGKQVGGSPNRPSVPGRGRGSQRRCPAVGQKQDCPLGHTPGPDRRPEEKGDGPRTGVEARPPCVWEDGGEIPNVRGNTAQAPSVDHSLAAPGQRVQRCADPSLPQAREGEGPSLTMLLLPSGSCEREADANPDANPVLFVDTRAL